ncbi:hypothetical protein D3C85_1306240 [compost metagenome]
MAPDSAIPLLHQSLNSGRRRMPMMLPARAISIQTQPCRLPDAVPSKKPPRLQALYMAPIYCGHGLHDSDIGARLAGLRHQEGEAGPVIPNSRSVTRLSGRFTRLRWVHSATGVACMVQI